MLTPATYAQEMAGHAKAASRAIAAATGAQKTACLRALAANIRGAQAKLLEANARDLAGAERDGLTKASLDRLRITPARIETIAAAVEEVIALPDPVGELLDGSVRPNGLRVQRVRVPLGVVFFIFESRPNVTVDAAALCLKSGNAVILRGGKEALHTNVVFHQQVQAALEVSGLPRAVVQLVDTPDRAVVGEFLRRHQEISVTIPRGGKALIERVVAEATMPVMKHYDGICHIYVDRAADFKMATEILINSKCARPGVCNAAECLLVHRDIAPTFLPEIAPALIGRGVELRCCPRTLEVIPYNKPATEEDFRTEYLDLILSVKVVDDLEQAMAHIEEYGSHHTDVIVTGDFAAAQRFVNVVDSAAVVVNASSRFNDGGELGLGAEIGISTDKFHARGPCGLRELTSYKYVVIGEGQIRP